MLYLIKSKPTLINRNNSEHFWATGSLVKRFRRNNKSRAMAKIEFNRQRSRSFLKEKKSKWGGRCIDLILRSIIVQLCSLLWSQRTLARAVGTLLLATRRHFTISYGARVSDSTTQQSTFFLKLHQQLIYAIKAYMSRWWSLISRFHGYNDWPLPWWAATAFAYKLF